MTDQLETVVIGAGVVGLAIGAELARAGQEILILEAASAIGTETSSRNSEVIHAGIYYPKGSLKARLCVRGKHLLYEFCDTHGVPHQQLGKLIVAPSAERAPALAQLLELGLANGVDDLVLLDKRQVEKLEPAVRAEAAILSPSTGIIDSHALLLALEGEIQRFGGVVALNSRFEGALPLNNHGGFEIAVRDSKTAAMSSIRCTRLINSAGHGAWDAARHIDGLSHAHIPPHHLCKGSYFSFAGKSPFGHLVYPMPRPESLGIHGALDLAGQLRFGPDAEWVTEFDYDVDPERATIFYDSVRDYFPALPDGALHPAYSGIRPKIQGPDDPMSDFMIEGPAKHGLAGLINLFGIESPGLTSCLAIAEHVGELLKE